MRGWIRVVGYLDCAFPPFRAIRLLILAVQERYLSSPRGHAQTWGPGWVKPHNPRIGIPELSLPDRRLLLLIKQYLHTACMKDTHPSIPPPFQNLTYIK
jgi:hypothetical protein